MTIYIKNLRKQRILAIDMELATLMEKWEEMEDQPASEW